LAWGLWASIWVIPSSVKALLHWVSAPFRQTGDSSQGPPRGWKTECPSVYTANGTPGPSMMPPQQGEIAPSVFLFLKQSVRRRPSSVVYGQQ
jgi:hypothetical protein